MRITYEELCRHSGPLEHGVRCHVCEGSDYEIMLHPEQLKSEHSWLETFLNSQVETRDAKDQIAFTQSTFPFIVRCLTCRTVFRNPQPRAGALKTLYTSDHYDSNTLEKLTSAQKQHFGKLIVGLSELIPKGSQVLEVGSFTGAFLQVAASVPWQATGIDIGEQTTQYMRNAGLRIIRGEITDDILPDIHWDAIFVWNTFDQLAQPRNTLNKIFKLLKPRGKLVLRIPNGEFKSGCIDATAESNSPRLKETILKIQTFNNFMTFPYLTGYTRHSITKFLQQSGFNVHSISGDSLMHLSGGGSRISRDESYYQRLTLKMCERLNRRGIGYFFPWLNVTAERRMN